MEIDEECNQLYLCDLKENLVMLQKWELYRCTLTWVHTQLGRIFEPTSDFQKEIVERVIGCKVLCITELCVKGICWVEKQSLALEPELL